VSHRLNHLLKHQQTLLLIDPQVESLSEVVSFNESLYIRKHQLKVELLCLAVKFKLKSLVHVFNLFF
jgi:hypothetical protein